MPITSTSEYLADVFEFEDGLPSQVNSMAQTPDGYLWLGTQKGLFAFDGVTFTQIADPHLANPTAPAAPIPHLPPHRLFAQILLVDRSGRLWVQWADGLACFQDGRMRPFGPDDGCPSQWNISQCLSGSDGTIYLNNRGTSIDGVEYKPTVHVFDGVRFSVLSDLSADFPAKIPSRSLRQTGLNHIYVDPHNQLWGIYRNHLESFFGRFDAKTKQWVREPYPGDITGQGLGALTDAQGNLLVLEQRVIRRFDGRDWSVQRQFGTPLKPHRYANGFDRLFQDHLGQIWFAGLGHFPVGEGLYRIATNGSIFQLTYPEDLDSRSPSFVFEDQEHNLWTSTDEGVQRLKPRVLSSLTEAEGLAPEVSCLAAWPGHGIAIGTTEKGLQVWNGGSLSTVEISSPYPSSGGITISSLLSDPQGRLFIGTPQHGLLVREDGITKPWDARWGEHVAAAPLLIDSAHRLWIQMYKPELKSIADGVEKVEQEGYNGLLIVSGHQTQNLLLRPEARPPKPPLIFAQPRVVTAVENAPSGEVWLLAVGNGGGLYRSRGDGVAEVRDSSGGSITNNNCMFLDPDGALWFGAANGISRFQDGTLRSLNETRGLPPADYGSIALDARDRFWFGTSLGIVQASRSNLLEVLEGRQTRLHFQHFTRSDGLISYRCNFRIIPGNPGTVARDETGRIWYPTPKGIAIVDPAKYQLNAAPPLVHIAKLGLDGRAVDLDPKEGSLFRVPPGTRLLQIHYTAPNFSAPEKVRFQYRLKGLDETWVDAGKSRVASFQQLTPGEYVFQVIACNHDGLWSEAGASLQLVVPPQQWKTWWYRQP